MPVETYPNCACCGPPGVCCPGTTLPNVLFATVVSQDQPNCACLIGTVIRLDFDIADGLWHGRVRVGGACDRELSVTFDRSTCQVGFWCQDRKDWPQVAVGDTPTSCVPFDLTISAIGVGGLQCCIDDRGNPDWTVHITQ